MGLEWIWREPDTKGVILSEPGCAWEKEEGETALGLDGRKSFLPDLALFLKSDQANGDRPKGGPTTEGGNVEIRPSCLLVPEVQMSFLCSGPG